MCDFISGRYTVTWNALPLGQLKPDEGARWSSQDFGDEVKGDTMGQTPQEIIFQGSDHNVSFTLIEFVKGLASKIFNPWNTTPGVLGPIGTGAICGDFAKPLILTAVGGSALSQTAPATRTAPRTILAPGFTVDVAFSPKLREVPVRLKVLPTTTLAVTSFYTDT